MSKQTKTNTNNSTEGAYNNPISSKKVTGKSKKTEFDNQWTSTLKNNNSK